MAEHQSNLDGKRILAVDDEADILETIQDILDMADVDVARDYNTASEKIDRPIRSGHFGYHGRQRLVLLEEAVARGIPSVMLTAHAINPDTLMSSIRKGAISYLPKETLAELDELLEELLAAQAAGKPPWKLLFDKLGSYFDERFGPDWKAKDKAFWSDFSRTWEVGRGIQERLKHDNRLLDKGI
jgi:CheY-like chemotaxis protein